VFRPLALAAIAASVLSVGQVHATVVSGTIDTFVGGEFTVDTDNWFGQGAGANLAGQAETITYSYDPATAFAQSFSPNGDSYHFTNNGSMSISVTIGAATIGVSNVNSSLNYTDAEGAPSAPGFVWRDAGIDRVLGIDDRVTEIDFFVVLPGTFTSELTINSPLAFTGVPADGYVSIGNQATSELLTFPTVPEPSSLLLLATAIAGVSRLRKTQRAALRLRPTADLS
jgi:hypothetical protein